MPQVKSQEDTGGSRPRSAARAQPGTPAPAAESRLDGLRLLIALDALLVHGSVSRAAERMGLGTPAMSRILKQIRERFGDDILIRTPKGMIPTPFAESLRQRLRLVAAETEDLLAPPAPPQDVTNRVLRVANIHPPPQWHRETMLIDDMPVPVNLALKLSQIVPGSDPKKRLAKFIATTGAGIGRSRPLTEAETEEAFQVILAGDADPIQIGALLIVLHYRGTTATELAGLVRASRKHLHAADIGRHPPDVDLDWPAYLSPKSRSTPWFLLAAKMLAQAGHRVLLHGHGTPSVPSEDKLGIALHLLDIPVATSQEDARAALAARRIAYLPLPALSSQLHRLTMLYGLFEMRSPMNLLVHLLNPLGAPASLLGAVNPVYRTLHRDTAAVLAWPRVTVIGNHRDVAQATPYRTTDVFRLEAGEATELVLPSQSEPKSKLPSVLTSMEYWESVWRGRERDPRARQTVIDTAALALMTLKATPGTDVEPYRQQAAELWENRWE